MRAFIIVHRSRRTPRGRLQLNETRDASCPCISSCPRPYPFYLVVSSRNNTMIVSSSTALSCSEPQKSRLDSRSLSRPRLVSRRSEADKIAAGYLAYTRFTCVSERYSYLGLLSLTSAPRAIDIAPRYRGDHETSSICTTTVPITSTSRWRVRISIPPPRASTLFSPLGFLDRLSPHCSSTVFRRKVNGLVTFGVEYTLDKILYDIEDFYQNACSASISLYIARNTSHDIASRVANVQLFLFIFFLLLANIQGVS